MKKISTIFLFLLTTLLVTASNTENHRQKATLDVMEHENIIIVSIKKTNNLTDNSVNHSILYTVKEGDTLTKIARRYKISVEDLRQINNLKSDLIVIGQVLKVGE